MSGRPRFGLIGTGAWARNLHAPAAAQSDAVEFTAVFGRNALKATAFAAPFGVRPYADLGTFLDSVDLVGICVPPDIQPQFALAAAKADKPVLLEKPIARDPAAAEAIAAEFEARGLPALVFFTQLLTPRVRAWADDAAAQGGWISARIETYTRILSDPANPVDDTAWRAGVGALWDNGPHAVALLLTILGDVVEIVATRGHGDLKVLTLTHQSGALSTITQAMDAPASIAGETALFGASGKLVLPPGPGWTIDAAEAYDHALHLLAAATRGEPATYPDARFGLAVTKILAAAERSLADGRRVLL